MNKIRIPTEDMAYILGKISDEEEAKIKKAIILITECGGFLGYYVMQFFAHYYKELQIKKVIALENFLPGTKGWLDTLVEQHDHISILWNSMSFKLIWSGSCVRICFQPGISS